MSNNIDRNFYLWCLDNAPKAILNDVYKTLYDNLYNSYSKGKKSSRLGEVDEWLNKCSEDFSAAVRYILGSLGASDTLSIRLGEQSIPRILTTKIIDFKKYLPIPNIQTVSIFYRGCGVLYMADNKNALVILSGYEVKDLNLEEMYLKLLCSRDVDCVCCAFYLALHNCLDVAAVRLASVRYDIDKSRDWVNTWGFTLYRILDVDPSSIQHVLYKYFVDINTYKEDDIYC